MSDFNGKSNTQVIAASSSNARDMCKVLETYAEGGYTDWYVPACGQLALIYLVRTEINAVLAKIGGTAFQSRFYWSSSENGSSNGWGVHFVTGYVDYNLKNNDYFYVRFARDII